MKTKLLLSILALVLIVSAFGQNTLELSFSQLPLQNIDLLIYNLQGELIIKKEFSASNNLSMDTSWLQNGIYIYHLQVDGNLYTGKVVKTD